MMRLKPPPALLAAFTNQIYHLTLPTAALSFPTGPPRALRPLALFDFFSYPPISVLLTGPLVVIVLLYTLCVVALINLDGIVIGDPPSPLLFRYHRFTIPRDQVWRSLQESSFQ